MPAPIYVYGILPNHDTGRGHAGPAWHGDIGTGLGGAPLRLLASGTLAAVISPASVEPIARSRRNMLTHTSVLERMMPHATVLPLRFGTVAPDEAALQACIATHRGAFREALHSIEGRVELGLKASWRKDRVFTDIVERDTALRQLRDRLQARPAGETYYERIELGRRVEAALAERRASETAAIMAELLPLAEREAELRAHDDDMVLNRAFLVARAAEAAFDAAVARIAERFAARLEFRYVGPVPPFNFVGLRADWLTNPGARP
jgi:hypothetical protein